MNSSKENVNVYQTLVDSFSHLKKPLLDLLKTHEEFVAQNRSITKCLYSVLEFKNDLTKKIEEKKE